MAGLTRERVMKTRSEDAANRKHDMALNLDHAGDRGRDRDRAARALQQLFGGASAACRLPSIPAALSMPDFDLLLVAGDNREGLSPIALKPLAMAHDVSVIATWADGILTGHFFEIDAVVIEGGEAVQFSAYRLWIAPRRGKWLVPANGNGDAVLLAADGPRRWKRQPWLDKLDLTLGIARGQAWMQHQVYGGTPFEHPLEQNLNR